MKEGHVTSGDMPLYLMAVFECLRRHSCFHRFSEPPAAEGII